MKQILTFSFFFLIPPVQLLPNPQPAVSRYAIASRDQRSVGGVARAGIHPIHQRMDAGA